MFVPEDRRVEVKPLKKDSIVHNVKDDLIELGEIISVGRLANDLMDTFYKVGDILAFEGWGCTKISYEGEDRWVVSTDKNVILGKFTKDAA